MEVLEKRNLIENIYKELNKIYNHEENTNLAIRTHIKDFFRDDKCKKCLKPNWEKLAISLGIDCKEEFEDHKCGYCKQYEKKNT